MFSVNEGAMDRGIRVVLGAVLIWLGTVSGLVAGTVATVVWVVGAVLVVTGVTGFCGLYKVFGINTCAPRRS
jgi:hypothetical protein